MSEDMADVTVRPNRLGIDISAKLRDRLANKGKIETERLRSMNLPPLGELERQSLEKEGETITEFGSISPHDVAKLAKISEVTGCQITIVGSASADPQRLAETRFNYGDTITAVGGVKIPRPVSDYDVLVSTDNKDRYTRVCGYVEQTIVQPAQEENPAFKADYLYQYGTNDTSRPYTVFKDGKVQDYSAGTDFYYSPRGGAAKPSGDKS